MTMKDCCIIIYYFILILYHIRITDAIVARGVKDNERLLYYIILYHIISYHTSVMDAIVARGVNQLYVVGGDAI